MQNAYANKLEMPDFQVDIDFKLLVKLKKSQTLIFERHNRFSEVREDVECDECPRRTVAARTDGEVQKIDETVRKYRRSSI